MYAAAYLLETLGYGIEAQQRELEDFAVRVAVGELEIEDTTLWFEDHSRKG